MSNSIHLISLLLLASGLSVHAQEKRAMTFDEMVGWERISEQRISDNGKWVFCKMEPWREMRPSCYIMIKEKRKILLNLLQKHNSVPPPNIS